MTVCRADASAPSCFIRKITIMSIAEVERFVADLQSNGALKAEAQKAQADKSHANPMDRAVAFGASKGYAFTADEAKAHATAKAKADGKVLTDAELDGVAGGSCDGCFNPVQSGSKTDH
jgi:uncharacterized small protein (DUF1192 family)